GPRGGAEGAGGAVWGACRVRGAGVPPVGCRPRIAGCSRPFRGGSSWVVLAHVQPGRTRAADGRGRRRPLGGFAVAAVLELPLQKDRAAAAREIGKASCRGGV